MRSALYEKLKSYLVQYVEGLRKVNGVKNPFHPMWRLTRRIGY